MYRNKVIKKGYTKLSLNLDVIPESGETAHKSKTLCLRKFKKL